MRLNVVTYGLARHNIALVEIVSTITSAEYEEIKRLKVGERFVRVVINPINKLEVTRVS